MFFAHLNSVSLLRNFLLLFKLNFALRELVLCDAQHLVALLFFFEQLSNHSAGSVVLVQGMSKLFASVLQVFAEAIHF